jgi:RNA 2',3'-cyclic 3'-phosphodiesterase
MSRGDTARLFVAVDPPVRACEQLAEWARGVAAGVRTAGGSRGAMRLLGAQSLHLTLCFLGSRPVEEIDALAATVGPCAEHTCELSVGAPLWLPARRPHALAVEIHDRSGELARVQERVSGALASVSGWEPQRRRFRPHITLARVRRGGAPRRRPASGLDGVGADRSRHEQPLPATPRLSFAPETIVLYRSWLAPEGARYEALASADMRTTVPSAVPSSFSSPSRTGGVRPPCP